MRVNIDWLNEQFGLDERVAIVTGGSGILGGAIARGLAAAGAKVAVLGRRREQAEATAAAITSAGGEAIGLVADVLDRAQLETVRDAVLSRWDRIDILINAAGGNLPGATLPPGGSIFNLDVDALRQVVDLNLFGTILPSQVFGNEMARSGYGSIVNISSMTAARAISRVAGYSAAKAAIDNTTRWWATELARSFGEGLRVNAIAPGFFVTEQNRVLLTTPEGGLTERGEQIVAKTPAGRFGEPDEVVGAVVWLCSPSARFVNGIVLPVDGGFDAFSGV